MKLFLRSILSLLFFAGAVFAARSSFEPVSKKSSMGAFIELAEFDNDDGKITYSLNKRMYNAEVELSSKFGFYSSSPVTPFLHSYSKLSYQYANITYMDRNLDEGYALIKENEIDSSDVKGRSDNHRITLEWGPEFRVSLINSFWNGKPLYDVLMVLNGGLIAGYSFLTDSDYKGSFIWGYDYGLSFRFEIMDRAFISSGFDWYHNYSRAYRKDGSNEKSNSMMIDFTQSGRLLLNIGILY